jgi:tetratricopeptide (TPR) repeat protein
LDYQKSEQACSKALEISSKDSLAFCQRGRARCNQKDFDNAITDLKQSAELDATNYEPHFLLGYAHLERSANDLAVADLLRAIALKPEYSASHILLSQAYFNLSRYQEALDAAAVAIGLQEDSAEAFCCRGKASFKLGEYENAISDLTQSIDKDPQLADGEHFYWRAEARDAIGEKELAEADRKAATEAGSKMEDREDRSAGL